MKLTLLVDLGFSYKQEQELTELELTRKSYGQSTNFRPESALNNLITVTVHK